MLYHKVLVKTSGRFIPVIRRPGPILTPVSISDLDLTLLTNAGFQVEVLETYDPHNLNPVVNADKTRAEVLAKAVSKPEPVLAATVAPTEAVVEVVEEAPLTPTAGVDINLTLENSVQIAEDGSINLITLTEEQYMSYTKAQLAEFLNKLQPALPDATIYPVESKSKTALMAFIKEKLI